MSSPVLTRHNVGCRLFRNITEIEKLSQLGVLFLLFEMGLELSLDRLKVRFTLISSKALHKMHSGNEIRRRQIVIWITWIIDIELVTPTSVDRASTVHFASTQFVI